MVQARFVFTDANIDKYQRIADIFYTLWLELNGREGMTNYIHSIGCSHLRYFLLKKRNLYKFSQQGWEHHNKRMLGIYHRHTQKGGNGSKDEDKGHIYPLFRHEVRCWMWKTNKGKVFFEHIDAGICRVCPPNNTNDTVTT